MLFAPCGCQAWRHVRGPHSTKEELCLCFMGTWVRNSATPTTTSVNTTELLWISRQAQKQGSGEVQSVSEMTQATFPLPLEYSSAGSLPMTEVSDSSSCLGTTKRPDHLPLFWDTSCLKMLSDKGVTVARLLVDSQDHRSFSGSWVLS